ncbi:SusC/RagA family TonB-linked outer membrane protein [Empedobacter brevis]|uniref:SusC/RagA family TonB-linked outer membrane protein n=1 Tax=Empedobacter brevis TaxID=247 RepID=UPI0028D7A8C4|nr:SusC/RagA family TonB-linked outer membrane protein [Empedobacter brevis]
MRKKITSLSLLAFLGLSTAVFAQTKGTVNDANGFPESDVEVTVKGTDKVVYTDENGNFNIDAKVGDVLVIDGKEFTVTSNDLGSLKLTNSSEVALEETVITVAYGSQKKETVVGSNAVIKSEAFEDRSLSNVVKALDGAAPGVLVSTGSGQPGSGINVQIRGMSSYNLSNSPLYIVDGAIYTGDPSDLNPNDIASLNILKDAASTSLYGSSAANGVVMITTKKGSKSKKGTFNFTANTGVVTRSIPQYDRVNADQYYVAAWESMRNGRLVSNPSGGLQGANTYATNNLIANLQNNIYNVPNNQVVIDGKLNPLAQKLYNDFDWDKYLNRVGSTENYNLSFSDATDRSTFYASFGYNKEEGYVIKSDFERYTARVSGDSQVTDWLKLGMNLNANLTKSNQADDGGGASLINPFYTSRIMGPIYSPFLYDSEGKRVYDELGNAVYDGIDSRGRGAQASGGRNVIEEILLNNQVQNTNTINSRGFAEFKLAKGLTFTTNLSYDVRNFSFRNYRNKYIGDAAGEGGLSEESRRTQSITFNQLLNYTKSFGQHNFDVLVGHESFERQIDYSYRYKTKEVIEGIYEFNNFLKNRSNISYNLPLTKESYFARLNYDFAGKYILSGSIRQDQSSRFDPSNNKGVFWSAGAGWNINKENFLKDSNVVNLLRLRGSYGEVGNDGGIGANPGYFADLTMYNLGDYFNADEPGVYLMQTGNKNLTWETNAQLDAGIEFGLFKNRISGSVEYFRRETKNMIFPKPLPGSAGDPGNSVFENIGTMRNTGWEFGLNFGIVRSEDFTWNLGVTATTFKNEVVKMPEGQEALINGSKRIAKGHSLYDFWLREWYGVDPTDGAGLFVQDPTKADTSATRVIDGKKYTTNQNNANYAYVGSALPDLYGSINNEFKYKNLSLTTLFTYQIGGKVYDSNYATLMTSYPQGQALHKDILNAWKNPGDITDVPVLSSQNYTAVAAASSRFLEKADYFMLKNATLGYTFNKKEIESLGLTNLKLFISGENLFAVTAKKGLEPVQSFNGTTTYRYTPSRIVSFGVNLSF